MTKAKLEIKLKMALIEIDGLKKLKSRQHARDAGYIEEYRKRADSIVLRYKELEEEIEELCDEVIALKSCNKKLRKENNNYKARLALLSLDMM